MTGVEMPKAPVGYVACRVADRGGLIPALPVRQVTHLVELDANGRNGGRPTVCGLTRFDERDPLGMTLLRAADLPGWGMGDTGVHGPGVEQVKCPGCWDAARTMSYEPVITEATNTTRLSPQQLRAIAECLDELDGAMHVQMDLLRSFGYGPLGDGSGAITGVTDGTAQNDLRRLADEMEAAIDASETGAPGPPGPNITGEWEAGTANIRAWVRGGGVFTPYLCAELEAWLNFFRGSNTGGIEGDKA